MIVITGATGSLGRLVVEALLEKVPAKEVAAAVRTPSKAGDFASKGVDVRTADYSHPETLQAAFKDAKKVLLISGNEIGARVAQHQAVIDAAKAAGVELLAYTSLLHADSSPLALAADHVVTENSLRASGVPFAVLRNGWYFENHTAGIMPAIEHGALVGASKNGRFAAAARADYAAAAAAVLTGEGHAGKIYELGGDNPYTRAEFAAEVSKQIGKPFPYKDLPEKEYEKILSGFLPAELAQILADADAKAAQGALDDTSHTLSGLIGRPTGTLANAIAAGLKA